MTNGPLRTGGGYVGTYTASQYESSSSSHGPHVITPSMQSIRYVSLWNLTHGPTLAQPRLPRLPRRILLRDKRPHPRLLLAQRDQRPVLCALLQPLACDEASREDGEATDAEHKR